MKRSDDEFWIKMNNLTKKLTSDVNKRVSDLENKILGQIETTLKQVKDKLFNIDNNLNNFDKKMNDKNINNVFSSTFLNTPSTINFEESTRLLPPT